jgi:hypothetical protein
MLSTQGYLTKRSFPSASEFGQGGLLWPLDQAYQGSEFAGHCYCNYRFVSCMMLAVVVVTLAAFYVFFTVIPQ